jgi:hypothetical protein
MNDPAQQTYRVVKRVVDASIDGKPCGFQVQRYYATFYGREPMTEGTYADPFVEVWADRSITLKWSGQSVFLYGDQWRGIVSALEDAMRDIQEKKNKDLHDWLEETHNAKVFHGTHVDLSRAEVIAALQSCTIELEDDADSTCPFIVFNGERHILGRTDLCDDVATGLCANKTAEEWREHYLHSAMTCYGGRISTVSEQGTRLFSVIDSVTDG